MQQVRLLRRHMWGIAGTLLIIAAFIVLCAASVHVRGLPAEPWACDEFDCADPIYDLRAPYVPITIGALLTGTVGIILLILARPIRWASFAGRPRGWSRALLNTILCVGLAAGVLIPWWALLSGVINWSVPTVSLVVVLGLTTVHIMLWAWLRRQHGRDRDSWGAALAVQAIVSVATVSISAPFLPLTYLLAPPMQLILLLVGARIAAKMLQGEGEEQYLEREKAASTIQIVAVAGLVVVIGIGTVWASLPRPVPEALQARIDAGDWPIRKDAEESRPQQPAPSEPAARTPATQPTQAAPECKASALDMTIEGWDAATGARAATLVVTNSHASDACQLQGLPGFRIIQAGDDLDVEINEYDISPSTEDLYSTITIGPQESAESVLYWRGERSAYHDDSTQRAQVLIDDTWVQADFEFQEGNTPSDSPFDVVEHSELDISKWSPSDRLVQ